MFYVQIYLKISFYIFGKEVDGFFLAKLSSENESKQSSRGPEI